MKAAQYHQFQLREPPKQLPFISIFIIISFFIAVLIVIILFSILIGVMLAVFVAFLGVGRFMGNIGVIAGLGFGLCCKIIRFIGVHCLEKKIYFYFYSGDF